MISCKEYDELEWQPATKEFLEGLKEMQLIEIEPWGITGMSMISFYFRNKQNQLVIIEIDGDSTYEDVIDWMKINFAIKEDVKWN